MSKHLLIVANTPSPNTRRLADAAVSGARHPDIDNVEVVFREPLSATPDDVLHADAVLLGSTENFGAMAGLIKDFFERIYYPCLEATQGKPFACYVRAGLDGQGTLVGIERIVTGLRWRQVQAPLLLHGDYDAAFETRVNELAMTVAASLDAGTI